MENWFRLFFLTYILVRTGRPVASCDSAAETDNPLATSQSISLKNILDAPNEPIAVLLSTLIVKLYYLCSFLILLAMMNYDYNYNSYASCKWVSR